MLRFDTTCGLDVAILPEGESPNQAIAGVDIKPIAKIITPHGYIG